VVNGTTIYDHTIISTDTTWTIAGSPYYLESNFNQWPIVESGATLTIEPGVKIFPQNAYYTFLEIRGTLKAEGTATDKIVFTSKKDSDYGGSGGAVAGDMKNIIFTSTSTNSVLNYTLFRYGGKDSETIKIDGSSIEIKNSIIENSVKNGIYLKNSNSKIENTIVINNLGSGIIIDGNGSVPEIRNCQLNDNVQYGIEIKNGTSPIIRDNSFSRNLIAAIYLKSAYPNFGNNVANNNGLNGISIDSGTLIDQDTTWNADLVYVLKSNFGEYITINEGKILTIKPGAIIKPQSHNYTALLVKGTIKAEATSGSEIIFTSLKDDIFGGDTNNDDNTTIPATGDWKKIKFDSTSTGSVFDHIFMYYGTGIPPIETVGSASVDIKDTVNYSP
jgi:parallel beta-helix repeat protein